MRLVCTMPGDRNVVVSFDVDPESVEANSDPEDFAIFAEENLYDFLSEPPEPVENWSYVIV